MFYLKTKRNGILIIEHRHHGEGKPLFEMCWFHMGIAQIALDQPPTPLSNGQNGKKVPQTILASLYTPSPPYRQKGAFLSLPDPILPNNGVIAKAMKKNHPHQQGEDATHVSKVAHPVCYRNKGWYKLG